MAYQVVAVRILRDESTEFDIFEGYLFDPGSQKDDVVEFFSVEIGGPVSGSFLFFSSFMCLSTLAPFRRKADSAVLGMKEKTVLSSSPLTASTICGVSSSPSFLRSL